MVDQSSLKNSKETKEVENYSNWKETNIGEYTDTQKSMINEGFQPKKIWVISYNL